MSQACVDVIFKFVGPLVFSAIDFRTKQPGQRFPAVAHFHVKFPYGMSDSGMDQGRRIFFI
jgi:hypothetical protein